MTQSTHLISCEQLNQIIDDENLVILDASMPPVGSVNVQYLGWPNQVINRAQRFDIDAEFSDLTHSYPHTMLDENSFKQKLKPFGIHTNTKIVVYDNIGLYSAPRAWWMLKSIGITEVSVLDGGLPKWIASGFPTNKAHYKSADASTVMLNATTNYFVNTDTVLENLMSKASLVVDARASQRFNGEADEPRAGVRKGHIPNSVNMPFTEILSNHSMSDSATLIQQFNNINPNNKPMIFSCGSGVTACVLALGATLCGYKDILVYDGSWAEWGARSELPIK